MVKYGMNNINTLFFYNITFYKNIHAEICEILRIFENKPQAEILKKNMILCFVWICKYNTIICFQLNCIKFLLSS